MAEVVSSELAARVRAWIAADPDPDTRAEAEELLERALAGDDEARVALRDAFDGRLAFGTAGLRAAIGAGPRRINRVVVAQTSAGLADFLLQRDMPESGAVPKPEAEPPLVVVGYDARLKSDVFARDAAAVFAGAGLRAVLLPEATPTPVVAFAVRHLGAAAGVMITASHNPPGDNGYKVYLGGADAGCQIAPPHDRLIAERVAKVASASEPAFPKIGEVRVAGSEVIDAYEKATVAAVRSASTRATQRAGGSGSADPTIIYTAMHGVGGAIARRIFDALDLPAVIPVREQDAPDGHFPTLVYPNPEEPGALDLAYALANHHDADYVIAQDPDADRLAVAARDRDTPASFRRLTGNELGLLLGWRAAEQEHLAAKIEDRVPRGALANTVVSSPALGAVARTYGLTHTETLPGFKWVARVPELLFGYEEALGYLTNPHVVGDKDGVSAAAEVLCLLRELHTDGRSIWDHLDEASEQFGHFASAQIVLRRAHAREVGALSRWIRQHPPTEFGGLRVERTRDFEQPGLAPEPADILAYDLEDGSRVMIRPSGTEPKLKIYLDAFSDRGSAEDRRASTRETLAALEVAVRSYLSGAELNEERP